MAIRIEDEYTNATPANADYPGGSFKNESGPGNLDGTPLEQAWANDIWGFLDAIMAAAGVGYSGAPDKVGASNRLTALQALFVQVADAVSTATAHKVVRRDANGRTEVVEAVASGQAVNKGQLDAHTGASSPHSGHATVANLSAHTGQTNGPHAATSLAYGNQIAQRDASGRCRFIAGVTTGDAVTFDQFPFTASASGTAKFPGGLILRWTTVTGNGYFAWPSTFSGILGALVLDVSGFTFLASGPYSYTASGFTHTSISVNSATANGVTKIAFAIGY